MNKTIVITGGSGGLGKRLVRLFSMNKDNVCSLSRSNDEKIENHFYCDVKDEQSVENAINSVVQKFGKIDMLICNSGIGLCGAIGDTPTDLVKNVIDVNFYGVLYTIKSALKHMNKEGKIIAISSASAFFALPYRIIYSASKSALNMMMFGLLMELSSTKIQTTSICPGEIDTDFVKNRLWHIENSNQDKNSVKTVADNFIKKQKGRMDADTVALKIFKICYKKRLCPLYIIGLKYKLFYFASKIIPFKMFLKLTNKMYGAKKDNE